MATSPNPAATAPAKTPKRWALSRWSRFDGCMSEQRLAVGAPHQRQQQGAHRGGDGDSQPHALEHVGPSRQLADLEACGPGLVEYGREQDQDRLDPRPVAHQRMAEAT